MIKPSRNTDNGGCILCGKPVRKTTSRTRWANMLTSWTFAPKGYEGPDSQGMFPMGSDCWRRHGKALLAQGADIFRGADQDADGNMLALTPEGG